MKKARCLGAKGVPPESGTVPSMTKKNPRFVKQLTEKGYSVFVEGGWAYISRPALLLLTFKKFRGRKEYETDVAPFFRENWGRLSEKRRDAICASMPEEVVLDEHSDVAAESLGAWLEEAKKAHKKAPSRKKQKDLADEVSPEELENIRKYEERVERRKELEMQRLAKIADERPDDVPAEVDLTCWHCEKRKVAPRTWSYLKYNPETDKEEVVYHQSGKNVGKPVRRGNFVLVPDEIDENNNLSYRVVPWCDFCFSLGFTNKYRRRERSYPYAIAKWRERKGLS